MANTALRTARESAGFTRDQLADALRIVNPRLAVDQRHIGRLERGDVRQPQKPLRDALSAVLGLSPAELGLEPQSTSDTAPEEISAPSEAALSAVSNVLTALRRQETALGPASVLPTALEQLALTEHLADAAKRSLRRPTLSLLANVATYAGWLSLSLDQFDAARVRLDRATAAAIECDSPMRLSSALSFSAFLNVRKGNLCAAESLTEAAGRDERVSVGLRAYLAYQRAEILGQDNVSSEARRVLRTADRLANDVHAGDWAPPWYFTAHRALALAAIGDKGAQKEAAAVSLPDELSSQPLRLRQAAARVRSLL